MVNKEIINMGIKMSELGFYPLEIRHCINEAYSCWGRISKKRQNLFFLVFDIFESSLPDAKKEKIRKMFPEIDIIHKMYELEFPKKDIKMPVERFGEDELTIFAIGDGDSKKAQNYGDFLEDVGIKEMPVHVVDSDYVKTRNKPFERLLWFAPLPGRSNLDGNYIRDLHVNYWVRGVREISDAVRTRQKIWRRVMPEWLQVLKSYCESRRTI